MDENKTNIFRSVKNVADTAVITYAVVMSIKGLSSLAKDWWNYKTQPNTQK